MRRSPAAVLLAVLALAAPRGAGAGARPRYGGDLTVLLPSSPALPDPTRAVSPADLAAVRAAHATLLEVDERGALRPGLLEALPEAEGAGGAWRLRIAPGLRFQDGQPIGAADVAASLARLAGSGSAYGWIADALEGAAAVRDGRASSIPGVQVLSDRELRLAFSHPLPILPEALATLPTALVRDGAGGALVGAGPFRPVGATERGVRLAAFDGYHAGRPYADALLLAGADARAAARAMASGAADVAVRPEPLGRRSGAETGPRGVVLAVVSRRLGPAAEPARRALAALDRRDLARLVLAPVVPLTALLPPPLLPAAPPRAPAREVGAPPARLTLLLPDGADAPRAAAARIQVKLYDRGVRVALESAPAAVFASRLASGDFDAALVTVWLVSRAPALELAQIAAAVGGRERGARALLQAAAADGAALPGVAAALEADLLAVPLYATGLRASPRDGLEGSWFRSDGTLELGDAWLMPRASGQGAPP